MPEFISDPDSIKPGDVYEDSAFHPCLCMGVDIDDGFIWGVSLIDGSHPRDADIYMGGIRKLTIQEAWRWKNLGPAAIAAEYNAQFPDPDS
jgi:hypothetical protein